MKFIIYQTTNNVNNKIYIGVHKTENINDKYLGSGKLLKQAIQKYGKENFTRETLFEFTTKQEAYLKEAEIVNEDFIKQKNVYNILKGGYGAQGLKHSKETKEKISKSLRGKKHSKETKEKMSKAHSGENNARWKKEVSLETRMKLSVSNSGSKNGFFNKKHSKETKEKMSKKHHKAIKIFLNGKEYNSISKAAENLNTTRWFIKKMLKES